MQENSSNKKIAKNTLFLYFRMMFIMLVSLYTSRVILDVLGADDYGLYQAVGGIVGMLAFINGALSSGSSRFLTYALGERNFENLKITFSTTFVIHLVIAIAIVLLAETVGLWFLYNKMQIASERMDAAVFVYHISILTAFFNITQVPYSASIIAHERMSIYAYVGIIEVLLRLLICYLLMVGGYDRLKMYASFLCILQIGLIIFYRFYCSYHFKETIFCFSFRKDILKRILGYSGWNLLGNGSVTLNGQGILILLNMFFSSSIVASRAISVQVRMAAYQFVSNFLMAVNPQIIKRYAQGNIESSHNLLLVSTKYAYFLMLIICIPLCLFSEQILHIWLKDVPPYTVIFLQIEIITALLNVFSTSFYTAFAACGKMRAYAFSSPFAGIFCFVVIYILFKLGFAPVAFSWAQLLLTVFLFFFVKPYYMVKVDGYRVKDIVSLFVKCLCVSAISLPIPIVLYFFLPKYTLLVVLIEIFLCVLSIAVIIYMIGIDKDTRLKLYTLALHKITGR